MNQIIKLFLLFNFFSLTMVYCVENTVFSLSKNILVIFKKPIVQFELANREIKGTVAKIFVMLKENSILNFKMLKKEVATIRCKTLKNVVKIIKQNIKWAFIDERNKREKISFSQLDAYFFVQFSLSKSVAKHYFQNAKKFFHRKERILIKDKAIIEVANEFLSMLNNYSTYGVNSLISSK